MIMRFILCMLLVSCCACSSDNSSSENMANVLVPVKMSVSVEWDQQYGTRTDAVVVLGGDNPAANFVGDASSCYVPTKADPVVYTDYWVLQFNGSGNNAPLVYKTYQTNIAGICLAAASLSRIVVIANTGNSSLFANFGGSYADFLNLYNTIASPLSALQAPLSGQTICAVSSGVTIPVSLRRMMAQISCVLKSNLEDYNDWSIQLKSVSSRTYYFPYEQNAPFPEVVNFFDDLPVTGLTLTSGNAYTFTRLMPPNLRGDVPGTIPYKRVANAPLGASYLEVSGVNVQKMKRVTYTLHLGSNFTTSYNIRPNYSYVYTITLAGIDTLADDRVSLIDFDVNARSMSNN